MPEPRHQRGQVCETILCEHLLRLGYWIFRPPAAQGPVDVIAINESGEVLMFDAKQDSARVNTGRKKRDRIYRGRTDLQKQLDVYIAYVNIETRDVYCVPPLTV